MAFINETNKIRSSGIIDIIRSTLNTLTNRAIRASSVSSAGIMLISTMSVSNIFQKLLKKSRLRGSAKKRIITSVRKKALINQSKKCVTCIMVDDNG